MMCLIMKSHKVIQGGIHTSRPQAVGNGKKAEKPGGMGRGEAEQGGRRHKYTDGGDKAGPQAPYNFFTEKAGNNGSSCNNHGNDTGKRNRDLKLPIHNGPGGAKQRIRQPQADKGYVNN